MSALTFADLAFLGAASGVGELYPVGAIVMWGSALFPDGWVVCDGSGSTPDLRGLFPVMAGSTYSVDDTGGVDSVTLTTAQLPSHAHDRSTLLVATGGSHTHTYNAPNVTNLGMSSGSTFIQPGGTTFSGPSAHSHNVSGNTASVGGGSSHSNIPAYHSLNYIMRVA